jgi:hypothetical protein
VVRPVKVVLFPLLPDTPLALIEAPPAPITIAKVPAERVAVCSSNPPAPPPPAEFVALESFQGRPPEPPPAIVKTSHDLEPETITKLDDDVKVWYL